MLQKNHLFPPRPERSAPAVERTCGAARAGGSFVSAEDFDATGILAGVDPCESRYWWLPELSTAPAAACDAVHAARSVPSAAAAAA